MSDWNALIPTGAGELSVSSQATGAAAEVQASYAAAFMKPRIFDQVRKNLIATCQRKRFADIALYNREVGKDKFGNKVYAEGFSVRMGEAFLTQYPNLLASCQTVYDDHRLRKIACRVIDLETNSSFSMEGTITKNIERKSAKGRTVISQRENSYGEVVFLVEAYEHEVDLKESALRSKLFRDCVLRLIPADLKDELRETVDAARAGEFTTDPITARKNMVDAFDKLGVTPEMIERFLSKKLTEMSQADFLRMKGIHAGMTQEGMSWDSATGGAPDKPTPARATIDPNNVFPGDSATHTEPSEPMTEQKPKRVKKPAEQSAMPLDMPAIDWAVCTAILEKRGCNQQGIDWAKSLATGRYAVSSIEEITKEQSKDFKVWFEGDLMVELQQENYLPMKLEG